jgi:hypothetical protein
MSARSVLAQLPPSLDKLEAKSDGGGEGFLNSDNLMLAGIVLALIAILFIGAKLRYSRKKKRRSPSRRRSEKPNRSTKSTMKPPGAPPASGSRKRRHARRNPTLAETGGLPPSRSEGQD